MAPVRGGGCGRLDPKDDVPEWRLGMAPVKDGFRGMVEEEPNPFPGGGGGGFGFRGMTIDGGWEELPPPDLRRGIEPSNEDFFFGILQEFDPLPLLF